MAAEASGRTVLAARLEKTAAIPAGIAVGRIATGHHIILLPKLAESCSVYISAAVIAAPAAVSAARLCSNRPVRTSRSARSSRCGECAGGVEVSRRRISVAALRAGQVLLHLLLDALLDEPGGVLVAVQD